MTTGTTAVACAVLAVLAGWCSAGNETETTFKWLGNFYDPHAFANFSDASINETCRRDMDTFVEALGREELWAVKMSDSSGRYSSQFFFGNDYMLGSQTLCGELSKSQEENNVPPFPLRFHVARLLVKLSSNLTPRERLLFLGLCLPTSCSSQDIANVLTHQYNNSAIKEKASLTVSRVRPVPGSYSLLGDKKFFALGGSVLVIVLLMTVGTLLEFVFKYSEGRKNHKEEGKDCGPKNDERNDIENNNGKKSTFEFKGKTNVYKVTEKDRQEVEKESKKEEKPEVETDKQKKNFVSEFFLSFSILSNARKILNCSSNSEESLNSVHGLRFLSLAWVILVHTYLQIFAIGENKGLRAVTERKFIYHIVGNATYSVDSFFIISGLLVSYLYFKNNKDNPRVDTFLVIVAKFFKLILYRFVRLTPVYLVVLGVVHLTMTYLKDISVFETPLIVDLNCESFWWRNILYVNNFFPRKEMCMLWSWYMAADTQFFVLSAIFLLLAKRYFKFSAATLFVVLLSSWCTTAYIAYVNQFRAKVQEPLAHFDELYDKPWTRIGPYIVGMCAGWLLSEKNCKISMPVPVAVAGWAASLCGLLGLVFCLGDGLGVAESSVYAALGHTAWGVCLAWIVVACRCGYGGWINSLLSCPAFYPFSRLTYCAYLVHPVIMFLTNYVMDGPFHMHNGVVMIIFFGNLISSFLLSFLLSLAFEAPFVRLLKLVLSPAKNRNPRQSGLWQTGVRSVLNGSEFDCDSTANDRQRLGEAEQPQQSPLRTSAGFCATSLTFLLIAVIFLETESITKAAKRFPFLR